MKAPEFYNPYATRGRWWRVSLHCHTTNSDGHVSPAGAVRIYGHLGYDAIAITDHDFVTRVPGHRGRPLLIPAAELNGPPDTLYLGARETGKVRIGGRGLQATIDRIRARGGLAFVAHPSWSGLSDKVLLGAHGYLGLEAYNQVTQDLNGLGRAVEKWDQVLAAGRRVWGLATDDCHFGEWRGKPGSAWVWVKAPVLTVAALLRALRRGAFHATQGPRILAVAARRGRIALRTSPAARVHLISAGVGSGTAKLAATRRGDTRWSFDIIGERLNVTRFARIEVLDRAGRTAWGNPLFVRGRGVRFW